MATATKTKRPKSKQYAWKEGTRLPVSADVAASELKRIKRVEGVLKAQIVVDHARDPSNPIHKCFKWDDTEAANSYRLYQARCLMHNLYTVKWKEDEATPDRPFIFNVQTEEDGRQYKTAAEIMDDRPAYDYLFDNAVAIIKGWRKRFAHIKELEGIHREIDKVTGEE